MKLMYSLAGLFLASGSAYAAGDPPCYGAKRWATQRALMEAKSAGLITPEKLVSTKTVKLASEQTGIDKTTGEPIYRQVQKITFTEKSGHSIDIITVSNSTQSECSMEEVELYITQELRPPYM